MLNNHKNAKDKNKMISNNRNHHFKRLRKKEEWVKNNNINVDVYWEN